MRAHRTWWICANTVSIRRRPRAGAGLASGSGGSAVASRRAATRDATLWAIWARWICIEIYDLHASLRLSMAGADQPWSVTELGIADL